MTNIPSEKPAFTDAFESDTLADGTWTVHGRGSFAVEKGVLRGAGGWVSRGGDELSDYSLKFRARVPESAPQVQIWAGFRHFSVDYRYVVALRGGANNHLYLARYGAAGRDRMLALADLPCTPSPGEWFDIEVIAAGATIAVYLGNAARPLILAHDGDAPVRAGGVSLGGGPVPAEFTNVVVTPVDPRHLDGVLEAPSYLDTICIPVGEKESVRRRQRAEYRPINVPRVENGRLDVSLEGNWLFIPDYEVSGEPASPNHDDSAAHLMQVPQAWTPLRAWLEGETMDDLGKGANDTYILQEERRCRDYTFDSARTRHAWYRQYLDFPAEIGNKSVAVDFEGVALISSIYFNGVKVHENAGMFGPFQVDVSEHVKPGRNVLAVHVFRELEDGKTPPADGNAMDEHYATAWNIIEATDTGRTIEPGGGNRPFDTNDIPHGFYLGYPGGIWRPVNLVITGKVRMEECVWQPTLEGARVEVAYANRDRRDAVVELCYEIREKASGDLLCEGVVEEENLASGTSRRASFSTPGVSPRLWAPWAPNLYVLTLFIRQDGELLDRYAEQVGFRTSEVRGQRFYINGKPLWLRGANHMPAHLVPNDPALARKFMQLAREHNVIATRTHVSPWTGTWLDAADEAGILVSFEGTFTWLLLNHIPDDRAIRIWKDELDRLLRKHRNRPSFFLMTMNNEMKFYLRGEPDDIVRKKGALLDEGVKVARALLPDRPLVIDSAYYRAHALRSGCYDRIIKANGYDDGDMDDPHCYFGWYEKSFFHFMKGEFGEEYCLPGRACMSQECAVGYPRAEDGLPTRSYLFQHLTPQTTVGRDAYEDSDPAVFLRRHAMLAKELLEMFRRVEHERTCGVLLFAFETWFYNPHDHRRVMPMRTAKSVATAYQPVLASAELWGRHFFAGTRLACDITLVNDSLDHRALEASAVECRIIGEGRVWAEHTLDFGPVDYYQHAKSELSLPLPEKLPQGRMDARLELRVVSQGRVLSVNEYEILLAEREWAFGSGRPSPSRLVLQSDETAIRLAGLYGIPIDPIASFGELADRTGVLVCTGNALGRGGHEELLGFARRGGAVVLLGAGHSAAELLGRDRFRYTESRQEFVTMNLKEDPVFDGLDPLDLAWFGDGENVPFAACGRFTVHRLDRGITVLGESLDWHGYLQDSGEYEKTGGTPLFRVDMGQGVVFASQVRFDAVEDDPVCARVNGNILRYPFDHGGSC